MSIFGKKKNVKVNVNVNVNAGKKPTFRIANSIRCALKHMDDMMSDVGYDRRRIETEIEVLGEFDNAPYNLYKIRCFYEVMHLSECYCFQLIEYANDFKSAKEFYKEYERR